MAIQVGQFRHGQHAAFQVPERQIIAAHIPSGQHHLHVRHAFRKLGQYQHAEVERAARRGWPCVEEHALDRVATWMGFVQVMVVRELESMRFHSVLVLKFMGQPPAGSDADEAEAVGLLCEGVFGAWRVEVRLEVLDKIATMQCAPKSLDRISCLPSCSDADGGCGYLLLRVLEDWCFEREEPFVDLFLQQLSRRPRMFIANNDAAFEALALQIADESEDIEMTARAHAKRGHEPVDGVGGRL